MARKGENTYTQADLNEIEYIFSNTESYNALFSVFYNGANKAQIQFAGDIRSRILTIVEQLKKEKKTIESPELSFLISDYKEKSPTINQETDVGEKNTSFLEKSTVNLTRIVDSFSKKIFKYKTPGEYAFTISDKFATPKEKQTLNSLTAYQALAKRYISLKSKTQYAYTQTDIKAIESIYGKGKIPTDSELSIKEIHEGLKNAYEATIEITFVKSATKTDYLKRTGWHGKNIGILAGIASSVALLGSLSIIGGIPSTGASSLAIWNFIGSQMAPIFASGLILGAGGSAISQLITNRRFNKNVREQIRQLHVRDKKILFDLIRSNTPSKGETLTKCIKQFKSQALVKGLDSELVKVLTKRGTYKSLIDVERKFGGEGIWYGASSVQAWKKARYDETGIKVTPNRESNLELQSGLAELISRANNLGGLLGIEGTKVKGKSSTPAPVITPTISPATVPFAAREHEETHHTEESSSVTLPDATEEAIMEILKSKKAETQDFSVQFNDSMTQIVSLSVEISKEKAALTSRKAAVVMTELSRKINSLLQQGSTKVNTSSEGVSIKVTRK